MPFPKGVFYSKDRATETYWRAANIYYRNLDMILLRIARMIEEKGEVAVPVFGCFPYDSIDRGDFRGFVSLVKMAETAGIGKTGKNGLLFNADYGPRLMLGGVITTADLPAMAWPQKDEKGCPDDCFACQEACPVNAIDRSGKVDRLACVKHSMKSPVFSYLMKTKAFDPSEAALINHVSAVDDHSMYTCINCVSKCPYC
jgi:epoxyqueuosine reductase QueG